LSLLIFEVVEREVVRNHHLKLRFFPTFWCIWLNDNVSTFSGFVLHHSVDEGISFGSRILVAGIKVGAWLLDAFVLSALSTPMVFYLWRDGDAERVLSNVCKSIQLFRLCDKILLAFDPKNQSFYRIEKPIGNASHGYLCPSRY
jgi:hypothetical protein